LANVIQIGEASGAKRYSRDVWDGTRQARMTPETPDNARSKPSGRPPLETADSASITPLEQALAAETRVSAALPVGLDDLRAKVEQLEAAARRNKTAESKLADQQKRLVALGNGREETMRRLADTRAELARVRAERDDLLKKLDRSEGMQTATIALTDEEEIEEPTIHPLPSMEDLMAPREETAPRSDPSPSEGGHALAQASLDDGPSAVMIAPHAAF